MPQHPALVPGRVAVVTGGASGIGLAAARRFAALGLKVVVGDRPGEGLEAVRTELRGQGEAIAVDVSKAEDLVRLRQAAERLGDVAVVMNNAGVGGGGKPWENPDGWARVLGVNLFGVLNGVQAFAPGMIARGLPGLIVNTGSKQGITTPPGDAAYNVSKAGIKVLAEQLAHELRNSANPQLTAHLLVPGYTFTGMTARGGAEKPAAAWTAEQVVDFLLESLGRGDFYILCPDNDVPRALDERRMAWAIGDVIENRPPLSRWHKDYAGKFQAFVEGD